MRMLASRLPDEWRAGWQVALVSMLGLAVSALPNYTIGIFISPLEAAFGWSRAEIASGLVAIGIFSILFGPFVGWLIDRFGPRKIGIPGLVGFCLALAALSTMSGSLWHWWAMWLVIASFGIMIKVTLWASVVSRRFMRHRGLALSVMMSGASIGSFAVPVLATYLIAGTGWRATWTLLGTGALIIVLPLVILYLHDGRFAVPGRVAVAAAGQHFGHSVREALLARRFIQIGAAALFVVFGVAGINVHLMAFLEGEGMARETAAWVVGTVGIASLAGRLGSGLLLDRVHGTLVGAVAFLLPVATAALLTLSDGGIFLSFAGAIALGLAFGAEIDVLAYIVSRYFGLRNYGAIFGILAGIIALASSLGPVAAGVVYDMTGAYTLFLVLVAIGSFAGTLLIATLGPYPDWGRGEGESG